MNDMINEMYPECDKWAKAKEEGEFIFTFMEWLQQEGYAICERQNLGKAVSIEYLAAHAKMQQALMNPVKGESITDKVLELLGNTHSFGPEYFVELNRRPEAILAMMYEVDLGKCELERQDMLRTIQEQN